MGIVCGNPGRLLIIIIQRREHAGLELSPYVPGRAWKGTEPEVESDETDSESEDHGDGADKSSADKLSADEPSESGEVAAISTSDPRP